MNVWKDCSMYGGARYVCKTLSWVSIKKYEHQGYSLPNQKAKSKTPGEAI